MGASFIVQTPNESVAVFYSVRRVRPISQSSDSAVCYQDILLLGIYSRIEEENRLGKGNQCKNCCEKIKAIEKLMKLKEEIPVFRFGDDDDDEKLVSTKKSGSANVICHYANI